MSLVLAYLVRFFLIILGYAVASLAASAFLNVVMLGRAGFTGDEVREAAAGPLIYMVFFIALVVAMFAFIPSIVAIAAGEMLGKRDWLFYAIAGAVIGYLTSSFVEGGGWRGTEPRAALLSFAFTFIGAGMCGGIAYWLVTGRTAGLWRQDRDSTTSPAP